MLKMSGLHLVILKPLIAQNPVSGPQGTHLMLAPRNSYLEQGSANYSLQAKSSRMALCLNSFIGTQPITYGDGVFAGQQQTVAHKPELLTLWPFAEKACQPLL